jgi:hypothetical protein
MKYHLNELPFYYEGSLAMLLPKNIPASVTNKGAMLYKFALTPKSTFRENSRNENSSVKIYLDSLKLRLITRQSLSGQFSTLLRPLYLNELVDSTVSPRYLKKCTEKPGAQNTVIKQTDAQTTFPFRYAFACNSEIKLPGQKEVSLQDWFSFLFSKRQFPFAPAHDFYFDFTFSDSYNFLLNFDRPVEIKNIADFKSGISNDWFELNSEIMKDTETSYLVRVKLVVKQAVLPVSESQRLVELVQALNKINSFSLELK